MNSASLDAARDPGRDASLSSGSSNQYVGRDAFGMQLGFFTGDYAPISPSLGSAANSPVMGIDLSHVTDVTQMYNGNIGTWIVNQPKYSAGTGFEYEPLLKRYHYDQLHRLKEQQVYKFGAGSGNEWNSASSSATTDWFTRYSFDRNGNITNLVRNGKVTATSPLVMDKLTYSYNTTPPCRAPMNSNHFHSSELHNCGGDRAGVRNDHTLVAEVNHIILTKSTPPLNPLRGEHQRVKAMSIKIILITLLYVLLNGCISESDGFYAGTSLEKAKELGSAGAIYRFDHFQGSICLSNPAIRSSVFYFERPSLGLRNGKPIAKFADFFYFNDANYCDKYPSKQDVTPFNYLVLDTRGDTLALSLCSGARQRIKVFPDTIVLEDKVNGSNYFFIQSDW